MNQRPEFEILEEAIAPYKIGNRTDSAALLAWFLENVWRMEREEVEDAICDGSGDKGIDALHVDDDLGEITIFQSKRRAQPETTQGDNDLRNLVGAAAYFESPEAVDRLLQSNPNQELTSLILRLKIREKLAERAYAVRLVFVTNAELDAAGSDYVAALADREPPLDVWSRPRLAPIALRTERPELLPDEVTLTAKAPPTTVDLDGETKLAVGVVPAEQLAQLPGIDDLTIFDPNVRLGRTLVNRELAATVKTPDEHPLFPAYHNGLTVLTNELRVDGDNIELTGISVVNGCQSLLTLYEHAQSLTDDLTVLVKAVQVDTESGLPEKITYRTNNQNSVDIRDQRSREPIQRDLQGEVTDQFGGLFGYAIRRGEPVEAAEVLSNESAAQMIMAVYLGEPWNAVRKVRLFDHDYRRIFNRTITAHKLYLVHVIQIAVETAREQLRADLASSFSSIRFTLAHLLAQTLRETEQGQELLDNPQRFLPDQRAEIEQALTELAGEVAVSINSFVRSEQREHEEDGEIYDAKVAFKSKGGVEDVEEEVLRLTRRLAERDDTFLFKIEPGGMR